MSTVRNGSQAYNLPEFPVVIGQMEVVVEEWEPLRPMTAPELVLLKNRYRQGLPDTVGPYKIIENHLKWCDKVQSVNPDSGEVTLSDDLRKIFYALADDDVSTSGTFVAITAAKKYAAVLLSTLQDDLSALKDALLTTGRIDWTTKPGFQCIALEHYRMLTSVLEQKDLHPRLIFRNSTHFRLPNNAARKLEFGLPEGYDLVPLEQADAHEVNESWPHRYPGSEQYYRSLIRLNGGLALRTRDPERGGPIAGWILTNEYGALAHLFIKPAYRKLGLATELAKAWSARVAQDSDSDVIAYILDANSFSRALFMKLGFMEMSPTRWSNPISQQNTELIVQEEYTNTKEFLHQIHQ